MLKFTGVIGVNDNDVVYTSQNVEDYDQHLFHATAGLLTVQVLINGVWSADVAFDDLDSVAPATLVAITTALQHYRLRGKFEKIRFLQSGATASNVKGAHMAADH